MRLLFPVQEMMHRALSRRVVLIIFSILFVSGAALGVVFIKTPAVYGYHLERCERFLDRVVYAERNLFSIMAERFFANFLMLLLLLLCGLHPAALTVTPVVYLFRAYTFGGSIYILFSVYRFTGILIAIALYLPVHLLLDLLFLFTIALSFQRAPHFRFAKGNFGEFFRDFLLLCVFLLLICLIELLLLLIVFRPIGNLI